MGRPPIYTADAARPVSVSVRIPQGLYTQVHERVQVRRMSFSEAILEGLQLWLETPTDPRELFLSDESNTVIQKLQAMVTTTVQAELAKLLSMALPLPTHDIQTTNNDILYDSSNTVLQESSPQPDFDPAKYRLGRLCPQGHDYQHTGQSLLRQRQGDCVECGKEAKRLKRQRAKAQAAGLR